MTLLQATWRLADDGPVLLGSRCAACGSVHFPAQTVCPACGPGTKVSQTTLSRRGRLHAFTQLHQAKPCFPTPYYMGYVDLPDGVRVPARIVCEPQQTPRKEADVELETGIVAVGASCAAVTSYVFRARAVPAAQE